MKKLGKKEWIAVGVSLGFLVYLLFWGPLLNLFKTPVNTNTEKVMEEPLKIVDEKVGAGDIAEPGDTVTAHYTGKLEDGRVFDSSYNRGAPISFTLGAGQVIRGWDEGLQGMRVGGKRTLTISPKYGYGEEAVGPIPANSTLIFEIELVGVEKGAK